MSPEAVATILGLWWVPVLLQGLPLLAVIFPQFLLKDSEFTDRVKMYSDANRVNLSRSLKNFVTAQIDADIDQKCLDFTNEASRRLKLGETLARMGRIYRHLNTWVMIVMAVAVVIFTAGLFAVIANKQLELLAFITNAVPAATSLILLGVMRIYVVKLEKMANNEDLSQ